MRIVFGIMITILALLLVLFAVQNPQPVKITFLNLTYPDIPLSFSLVAAAVGGAALVGILGIWGSVRRGLRDRRLNKLRTTLEQHNQDLERKVAALQAELENLKAQAPTGTVAPDLPPPSSKL